MTKAEWVGTAMPKVKITTEIRKRIVHDHIHGHTNTEIAKTYNVSAQQISNDKRRYKAHWKLHARAYLSKELKDITATVEYAQDCLHLAETDNGVSDVIIALLIKKECGNIPGIEQRLTKILALFKE